MKTFISSDLHLGHKNIIKFCKRPFSNVREMNKTIISNWNNMVSRNDKVYYLGDLCFSFLGLSNDTNYWLNKLNGDITFIKGNNDRIFHNFINNGYGTYKDISFFLTHNPKDVPNKWNDWIIHGHYHNHHMNNYPFFNRNRKRINVSIELTNYKPVNIKTIYNMIKNEKMHRKLYLEDINKR